MASPGSNDADIDAAVEKFLVDCINISSSPSSEVEDGVRRPSAWVQHQLTSARENYSSVPLSPEIGMARIVEAEISNADLSFRNDNDGASPRLSGRPVRVPCSLDDYN